MINCFRGGGKQQDIVFALMISFGMIQPGKAKPIIPKHGQSAIPGIPGTIKR
jgi:hypothetical protein